ncbi:MAG: diguanylate cyclase [Solirubrobacteraceae bacterium]
MSVAGVQARSVVGAQSPPAELAFALIGALQVPVVACDGQGRLVLASQAARALLGLGDGLDGDGFSWLEDDTEAPLALLAPLWRALEGQALVCQPLRLLSATGDSELVQVSAEALRDARGMALGAVMTILVAVGASDSEQRLSIYASDIELLEQVSQTLAELQDPDETAGVICTVVAGATGAIAVLLWELAGDRLVIRCYEGGVGSEELADVSEQARVGATLAMTQSRTVVQEPCDREPAGGPVGSGRVGLGSAWHQPLTRGGAVVGVLSVLWPGLLIDRERPGLLIRCLSDHAATALQRAELLRRLNDAARTDPLTGLANRRVWEESLQRELLRARRDGRPLSLLLIDIDHFKAYNDQYGHPQGDKLLQHAAQAWSAQLRATDLLARVGGEEFAVLLPGCPIDQAPLVAERLRTAMPDPQTCSLGAVTCDQLASASSYTRPQTTLSTTPNATDATKPKLPS